jgi:hypothetical protein
MQVCCSRDRAIQLSLRVLLLLGLTLGLAPSEFSLAAESEDAEPPPTLEDELATMQLVWSSFYCESVAKYRCTSVSGLLASASRSLERGRPDRAMRAVARVLQSLERLGLLDTPEGCADPCPQEVFARAMSRLVAAADAHARELGTSYGMILERVCTDYRARPQSIASMAIEQLDAAQAEAATNAIASAASYAAAITQLDAAIRAAASAREKCLPRRCPAFETDGFSAGEGESIILLPPAKGSTACYRRVEGFIGPQHETRSCLTHRSPTSSSIVARTIGFDGSADLVGSWRMRSCIDSRGWLRTSSHAIHLVVRNGSPRLLTGSIAYSPPGDSFLVNWASRFVHPGLWLTEATVGDRLEATDDRSIRRSSGAVVQGACSHEPVSVRHEVVGIEDVSVAAGTFRAARIESSIECSSHSTTTTTWIASGVGLLSWIEPAHCFQGENGVVSCTQPERRVELETFTNPCNPAECLNAP